MSRIELSRMVTGMRRIGKGMRRIKREVGEGE